MAQSREKFDQATVMKKWRILFTLRGIRTETVLYASSQLQALMIARAMFEDATNFNAIEVH